MTLAFQRVSLALSYPGLAKSSPEYNLTRMMESLVRYLTLGTSVSLVLLQHAWMMYASTVALYFSGNLSSGPQVHHVPSSQPTIFPAFVTMRQIMSSGVIHCGFIIGKRIPGCFLFIVHQALDTGCFVSSGCPTNIFIFLIAWAIGCLGRMTLKWVQFHSTSSFNWSDLDLKGYNETNCSVPCYCAPTRTSC